MEKIRRAKQKNAGSIRSLKVSGLLKVGLLTMEVSVKLISTFSQYKKNLDNGKAIISDNNTVADLAQKIGLPLKLVRLVFVNGKQADLETVLADGDNVFLPPAGIGGG
jgi:molybdopterin converting factor small subunit